MITPVDKTNTVHTMLHASSSKAFQLIDNLNNTQTNIGYERGVPPAKNIVPAHYIE